MRASKGNSGAGVRKTRAQRSPEHRLRSVRLVLDGISAVKVGRKYGDSPRAVAMWVERYKTQGKAGLENARKSGRPPRLDASQRAKVRQFVVRADTGGKSVSGSVLGAWIRHKFGVLLTRRQCERTLKRVREELQ